MGAKDHSCKGLNVHIKFSQGFIKRLNIQVSRILNWVKDKREMASEMGYSEADIRQHHDLHYKLAGNTNLLLEAK